MVAILAENAQGAAMVSSGYRIEVKAHATRRPSFSWRVFYSGDRVPVQISQQIFPTEAAARTRGEAALREYLRLIDLA